MSTQVFNVILLAVGISPILFQSASVATQLLQTGYDPVREAMSLLVLGPYGWLQTAVFYLFGISLIALAVAIFFRIEARFKAGVIGIFLLGTAFTVLAGNPTGAPGLPHTIANDIHKGASAFIVLAFPAACFLLAPILKATGHAAMRHYTIALGVFSLIFLSLGGVFLVMHLSLVGIYERILIWNGQLWIEFVCAHLIIHELRSRKRTADREPEELLPDLS